MFWFTEIATDVKSAVKEVVAAVDSLAGRITGPQRLVASCVVLLCWHVVTLLSFRLHPHVYFPLLNGGLSASAADFCASMGIGLLFLTPLRVSLTLLGVKLLGLSVPETGLRRMTSGIKVFFSSFAGPAEVLLRTILVTFAASRVIPAFAVTVDPRFHQFREPMFYYWLVFGCVVTPCVEELFFRGFVQGVLEKALGSWSAVAGTAALFSLMHDPAITLAGFLVRFGKGLIYSLLKKWEGTLWAPAAAHSVNNFVNIFFRIEGVAP